MHQSTNRTLSITAALLVLATCFTAVGCQEVEQPSTQLTAEQWQEIEDKYVIGEDEDPPEPEFAVNAVYGDRIEFLGYDIDGPLVAGKEVTFTWYWKALKDIEKNWKIFIHFDSQNEDAGNAQRRQNLDHHPLESKYEGYRTGRWRKGDIIKDVQTVKIRDNYPPGKAHPHIGFYRDQTNRLPITNKDDLHPPIHVTNDNRVRVHAHRVKSPERKAERPSHRVRRVEPGDDVSIDGRLAEPLWQDLKSLNLKPLGHQTELDSEVRIARSEDHLWVGARLEDRHIWSDKTERDDRLWEEEVFEMFLDPDGDGQNYLELQINPQGTIFDANFERRPGAGDLSSEQRINQAKDFDLEAMESSVHIHGTLNDDSDEDTAWSVELRIPFDKLPGVDDAPDSGTSWAANFYRFDRPDSQTDLAFAWSTAARGDFHQVDKFGSLEFGGESDEPNADNSSQENSSESGQDDQSDDNETSSDNQSGSSDDGKQESSSVDRANTGTGLPTLKQETVERLKKIRDETASE